MIAYDTEAEMIKIFSMDRVTQFSHTAEKFKLPKDFNPQTYFDDCFGIINNDDIPVETLRLKVYNDQDYFLRDLPLHPSQRELQYTDDYTIFEFDIKITFDLMQEIMSHGEDWEVLAPQHLREEIKRRVQKMNGPL
jgi:predicted DNA-binding transcriptional regulator YafY